MSEYSSKSSFLSRRLIFLSLECCILLVDTGNCANFHTAIYLKVLKSVQILVFFTGSADLLG